MPRPDRALCPDGHARSSGRARAGVIVECSGIALDRAGSLWIALASLWELPVKLVQWEYSIPRFAA